MKKALTLLLFILLTHSALADGGIGRCIGTYGGHEIELVAKMADVLTLESGEATVAIDGNLRAHFSGADMHLSLLSRSFSIENAHGDSASGTLTNPFTKNGVLHHLTIPEYGVDYREVKMKCWTKRFN